MKRAAALCFLLFAALGGCVSPSSNLEVRRPDRPVLENVTFEDVPIGSSLHVPGPAWVVAGKDRGRMQRNLELWWNYIYDLEACPAYDTPAPPRPE